jgi:hypothetical protein
LPNWTILFAQFRAGASGSCSFHVQTNSFLGGKLIVFKLCNYGQGNGVAFGIVSNYFVVYEAYFIVGKFQ